MYVHSVESPSATFPRMLRLLASTSTSISACPDLKSEEGGALGEDRDGNNTGTRDIQPLHQPAPTPAPTPPPAASNTSTNYTGSASTGTRHQHRHPFQPRPPTSAPTPAPAPTPPPGFQHQHQLHRLRQHRHPASTPAPISAPPSDIGSNTGTSSNTAPRLPTPAPTTPAPPAPAPGINTGTHLSPILRHQLQHRPSASTPAPTSAPAPNSAPTPSPTYAGSNSTCFSPQRLVAPTQGFRSLIP